MGNIKQVELIKGLEKIVTKSEKILKLLESQFIKTNINKGEKFTFKNLKICRPAEGLKPSEIYILLNKIKKKL